MSQKESSQMKSGDQLIIKEEQFELIKGEFSTEDAKEILLQLFADKIKYHQIRNLSSIERFGEEDGISSKRLPELRQHVQKIYDMFENDAFPDASFKIQATIHIEVIE